MPFSSPHWTGACKTKRPPPTTTLQHEKGITSLQETERHPMWMQLEALHISIQIECEDKPAQTGDASVFAEVKR